MVPPPGSELQKQTLWLFGVLVGLSIKEGITDVYQHLTGQQHIWGGLLEAARLFLFLLVVVRFYLGAVQYFYAVYAAETAATHYPRKSFRLDFFFGLSHFIFFSFLALSVTLHPPHGRWLFPVLLGFVLSYDIAWYAASRNLSTALAIRLWMVINAVTVVIGLLLYLATAFGLMLFANNWQMTLRESQLAACELAAFLPVLVASAIDLGSLLQGRSAFEEWLAAAIFDRERKPKSEGGTK